MFDAQTANLLRSAPAVPELDPDELPAILTSHYAQLASARLRGRAFEEPGQATWSLERIADTYELITAVHQDRSATVPAAFVAATAQQILARRQSGISGADALPNVDRRRLDPALAAPILFLAAEQYADANEAASSVQINRDAQLYEATILAEHIVDLGRGRLGQIVERGARWRRTRSPADLDERALVVLLEAISTGVEMLAAEVLDFPRPESSGAKFESAQDAFDRVIETAAAQTPVDATLGEGDLSLIIAFPGPLHLATLLKSAAKGLADASLSKVPMPTGSDSTAWNRWLQFRAETFPYVWPNHREAISKGFHQAGTSAVVVLPTGAGKTTVSSLKIAGALTRGKKVVFLAPTHALVEQLTDDLKEMFPREIVGTVISSDFDLLLKDGGAFESIEVMTPERCLLMLSFAPEAFQDVGLLVFDEAHLLSPQAGSIRRALDGMLCILAFRHVAPEADLLLLSAMITNGVELSEWLGKLTGRPAVAVDLLWKPSRQARGVVIYNNDELAEGIERASEIQRDLDTKAKKPASDIRVAAERELKAIPRAIWGLQHNWLSEEKNTASCILTDLLDSPVPLAGKLKNGAIRLTPNANEVAVKIAASAAESGLKTIVFVNTKRDAVSVAGRLSAILPDVPNALELDKLRWEALGDELGGLSHSVLSGPAAAVPHNSAMFRLERDLSERMFKFDARTKVIVATPTLAQGLNLPAHFAIIAGDKRAGATRGTREALKAHEILNSAARAGRAGHLANGLVLLIPEPIISFTPNEPLPRSVIDKLQSILPEDDHCVPVTDPLEVIIDRLMGGKIADPDVVYLVNRFAILSESEEVGSADSLFDLKRSFGAFAAQQRGKQEEFDRKVAAFQAATEAQQMDGVDRDLAILASRSGLPLGIILTLRDRIIQLADDIPTSVTEWVTWLANWLKEDEAARSWLLGDVRDHVLKAIGETDRPELTASDLDRMLPGLTAWVQGKTVSEIETALGGSPNAIAPTLRICPRARELTLSVVPRSLSFVSGLIAHVFKGSANYEQASPSQRQVVETLSTTVRRGFDSPEMLFFALDNPTILGRVQVHKKWTTRFDELFADDDEG